MLKLDKWFIDLSYYLSISYKPRKAWILYTRWNINPVDYIYLVKRMWIESCAKVHQKEKLFIFLMRLSVGFFSMKFYFAKIVYLVEEIREEEILFIQISHLLLILIPNVFCRVQNPWLIGDLLCPKTYFDQPMRVSLPWNLNPVCFQKQPLLQHTFYDISSAFPEPFRDYYFLELDEKFQLRNSSLVHLGCYFQILFLEKNYQYLTLSWSCLRTIFREHELSALYHSEYYFKIQSQIQRSCYMTN